MPKSVEHFAAKMQAALRPRDPARIPEILTQLQQIWEANPDLRLGQLILNLGTDIRVYNMEDDILIKNLYELYEVC